MATESVHYGIDDLHELITFRNSNPTLVLFIGTELTSYTANSAKGKNAFKKLFLGVVGIYTKAILKKELEEDMRETMKILHI